MSRPTRPHKATFVVRMWVESDGIAVPALRGQIEHVQSGEKQHLRDLDDVVQFIQEHSVAPTGPGTQRGMR